MREALGSIPSVSINAIFQAETDRAQYTGSPSCGYFVPVILSSAFISGCPFCFLSLAGRVPSGLSCCLFLPCLLFLSLLSFGFWLLLLSSSSCFSVSCLLFPPALAVSCSCFPVSGVPCLCLVVWCPGLLVVVFSLVCCCGCWSWLGPGRGLWLPHLVWCWSGLVLAYSWSVACSSHLAWSWSAIAVSWSWLPPLRKAAPCERQACERAQHSA